MDAEHAKKMMDAFYEAKRIRDQLPPLPEGVNPSYINTLDAVLHLSLTGAVENQAEESEAYQKQRAAGELQQIRVSDVAGWQHLPRPAVTRTVKEMVARGLLLKQTDEKDRRVVHLALTDRGLELYQTYVEDYFGSLTGQQLKDITNEAVDQMIGTIHRIGNAMGEQ